MIKNTLIWPTYSSPLIDSSSRPFLVACLLFRILVNMDDNIIEHYTNQSAFLIEISEAIAGRFQVILIEV